LHFIFDYIFFAAELPVAIRSAIARQLRRRQPDSFAFRDGRVARFQRWI
jgi:hypothetical protein